ncbi:isoquinoline 1-oxidoreductase beta subunit [Breoghania corrubedonensis]|uniref:Isoquinoline 1-oxidoreductase beta subunit n=1 Tax=Breoghania corrubedonensis TaxID=665038 RepID=A0A2T5V9W4_9HYPH|nr:molybdopterin cofactor-binding domain-containing protein [Breoghania corrubedonensis]PTW60538.1 isoquinoline 1-oxidoreductase beta subunit [Breoghania corrubedonensis]
MLDTKNLERGDLASPTPTNISRRGFLLATAGVTAGALVLSVGLPAAPARAQQAGMAPGTRVPAFLEIRPDNTIRFLSPFNEGGQGIFTAMAQIVGEELDADPAAFLVENAPAGEDYKVMGAPFGRVTGGSMSVRSSFDVMRRLGALARQMLLQAAASRLEVPLGELATEPGQVVHAASGRKVSYGDLSETAMDLPVPDPDSVTLKKQEDFSWIGKPVARLDVRDKSTGRAVYAIDVKVDGMLHAAVQHAPRLGLTAGHIRNEDTVRGMTGVHSVHTLDGAVAVVAERWWNAKRAVEALQVEWSDPGAQGTDKRYMPADFSTAAFRERLANEPGEGKVAEEEGDAASVLQKAENVVEATYFSQFLHHAQLEPPSTVARFNDDGTLDIWLPNQAPEQFQANIAKVAGIEAAKVNVHSPILGGFFGRHFLYPEANPYPQAIKLARDVGRPVKVIWSREEEFLRDPMRPMAAVRMRASLDEQGMPQALDIVSACEGPTEAVFGHNPDKVDPTAVEGLTGKAYAIPNRRISQIYVKNHTTIAYWRSVGNSMNDFLYEAFLDELADKGNIDPLELRMRLLKGNQRLSTLLQHVVDLSGGWKRGPFDAEDGTKRARGIAMASPFGSHTAAIAEVSIREGQVVVHDIWESIDPGSIVNPAIIGAQINSAAALGTSQALLEDTVYEKGEPQARNYDLYPILRPDQMPRVHVGIVESGEKMGGIGEPGLPAVPPAITNAVSHLTGKRVRSMPLSKLTFDA